jgi:hypothetical protein
MRTDMKPKLETAILEREVQYYNEVATQKQMPERLTKSHTQKALDKAVRMNEQFAKDAGFRE